MRKSEQKKRRKIGPFQITALLLSILGVFFLLRLPVYAQASEELRNELISASETYYEAQMENIRLKAQVQEVNSPDFIERTARRMYDYCWYGETIYEVANMDEILGDTDIVVYQAEGTEEIPEDTSSGVE